MFVITYRKKEDTHSYEVKILEQRIPSPLESSEDGKSILVGEHFDKTAADIFSSGWENNPACLNGGCSALVIARFGRDGCTFASDASGREILFYYKTAYSFFLSNDFWAIVKEIQPRYDDLDKETIEEIAATGGGLPPTFKTPIKNLFWVGANQWGKFDASSWDFHLNRFSYIRRTGEVSSMDDAVEGMDASMRFMADSICERHGDSTIGLGLSGGLDSRIALHYLLDSKLNLACFNVCTLRPHGLLLASSLVSERELARAAQVDCREVPWRPDSIRSKTDLMLRNQPVGTGGHFTNAYKYEDEGMPSFDVLVSAGQAIGPMLVGVSAFKSSDSMGETDLINYLFHLAIGECRAYSFFGNSLRRQLQVSEVNEANLSRGPNHEIWEKIAKPASYDRIRFSIKKYVKGCLSEGLRPADVTLDYRTSFLGASGRNGAYESRLGTCRSYTIYTPFLMKEALKWDIPIVEDRLILKELIKRKIPEFYGINEESYGSLDSSKSKASVFLQKITFAIRGSGIMADEWYAKHPAIKMAFYEDMNNDCTWFDTMFGTDDDHDKIWNMSPARMNTVWELKRLIDCFELKTYLQF